MKDLHTKGDWSHVSYPDERVKDSEGKDICLLNPHKGVDEAHANAKLITAAPDLLEALLKCQEYFKYLGGDNHVASRHARDLTDKAIKKATE